MAELVASAAKQVEIQAFHRPSQDSGPKAGLGEKWTGGDWASGIAQKLECSAKYSLPAANWQAKACTPAKSPNTIDENAVTTINC